jgi:hypothetical protein
VIRRALCAGLGLFVCFAAAPLAAQAAGPGPPAEAPLRLRLGGVVDTLVTALYWHDTVYLPIGELFADLGVSRSLEPGPRVTGFFIDRTARYELDFSHRVARVRGREIPLAPGTFIARDLDVYVIPALLDSIFEMRTTVDLRTLELRVDADETFPVVAAALRKRE